VIDADQLLLITERGQLIRIKVKDIRETGRAAQGVRVIQLEEGDRLVGIAKLAESDEGEEEPQAALPVTESGSKLQVPGSKTPKKGEADFLEEDDE
jgi:DNA gyrase subunit A